MSATTPDAPTGPSAGRRRRAQLVLVASALVVVAAAVGTSLAIATRPIQRPAAAEVSGSPAAQSAVAGQQAARPPAAAEAAAGQAPAATGALALDDGDHDAYITGVDAAHRRIVVDVVQVFHDARAVKEAVADGRSAAEAKYLTTWVRNENPRLRTLPLAGDVQVKLRGTCGEGGGDNRDAQLTRLAADARLNGTYYYTLTVDGGTVERIQERLAVNAC